MKFLIVFAALVAVCVAAPVDGDAAATSLRDNRDNNGIDKYNIDFETSNGIVRQETGELKQYADNAAIVVKGSASWTSPEGQLVQLQYYADDTGYHVVV